MIIISYQKKNHKQIIQACVNALKNGKVVAYPTDTSYGLAVDAANLEAIRRLYRIKERGFNQPVHVVVPAAAYARKIVLWGKTADKLSKKFWPGPLTIVASIKGQVSRGKTIKLLSANSGYIGLRYPDNRTALDLARYLKRPITTTSANPSSHLSGGFDSYSAEDVIAQFENKKYQPDIVINAGKLPKKKPSTIVKIVDDQIEILRKGPISEKQIKKVLDVR